MNSRISALLTVLLLGAGMFCCFAGETNIVAGVRTDFAPQAILSSSELATVVKLAKQCGVPNVAEISTYNNYHPSPFFSIGVKSMQITHGREVSFVAAQVDCERWTSSSIRRSSEVFKSIGGFWVSRGGVYTNVLTTFAVPGGTAYVRLSDDVPLPTADKIVGAFATGKIRYANGVKNVDLNGLDLSRPIGLDRDRGRFSISFSRGPWHRVFVSFTLEADGVTVVSIDTLVS